jgi:hypothetical protein
LFDEIISQSKGCAEILAAVCRAILWKVWDCF